eukprot:4799922-Pleurochrysis_carterae.AAC.5
MHQAALARACCAAHVYGTEATHAGATHAHAHAIAYAHKPAHAHRRSNKLTHAPIDSSTRTPSRMRPARRPP